MHVNTFDHYQNVDSPVHRMDPRIKLVLTIGFILSNALLPDGSWMAFLFSWVLVVIGVWIAKIRMRFVILRSLVALPFALAAITTIFTIPGNSLIGVQFGRWFFTITDAGLIRFGSIMIRSWISIQAAIIMTVTTPFPDLVHGMRHLRVPGVLVSIISFMYRYLFVLVDEAVRLLRARESRSAAGVGRKQGGSLFWRARTAGNMAGQLFLRSYERSDRVYNAMLARGYQGHLMTMNPHVMKGMDWIAGIGGILILVILQVITH